MKRRDCFFLSFATLVLLLMGLCPGAAQEELKKDGDKEWPEIRFKDGRFKILQMTDLHLKYDDHKTNLADSVKTISLMHELIQQEKPDMVVVTGDLTSDRAASLPNGVPDAFERLCNVFSEEKVPFAVTFGNHDNDRRETTKEILVFIQRNAYNLTRSDDETHQGAGTCVLSVLSSDGKVPKWNLWLFDSHQYAPDYGGTDWIKFSQIDWYRKRSQEFTKAEGHPVPALAFFHIPLPEYRLAQVAPDRVGTHTDETGGTPELNSGLFTSFIEMGDVQGIFVGHTHDCDFIWEYMNIALGCGRKLGFSSSGRLPRGARSIILHEDSTQFDTYIVEPGKKLYEFTHKR